MDQFKFWAGKIFRDSGAELGDRYVTDALSTPYSVSDDDLCSGCLHRVDTDTTWSSACSRPTPAGIPGERDADDYVVRCDQFFGRN